jgi:hypothetical protein
MSAYLEYEMVCFHCIQFNNSVHDDYVGKALQRKLNIRIIRYSTHALKAALTHWYQMTEKWLLVEDSYGYRSNLETGTHMWIRISTGQLCIEVNDNREQARISLPRARPGSSISGLHLASHMSLEDDALLSNTCLDDIHRIFSGSLGNWVNVNEPGTIVLGSLYWPTPNCTHRFNPFSEIPLSEGLGAGDMWVTDWGYTDSYIHEGPVILANGWTRYDCPFLVLDCA